MVFNRLPKTPDKLKDKETDEFFNANHLMGEGPHIFCVLKKRL